MRPIKFILLYWRDFAFFFSVRYVNVLTRALGPWGQTLLGCWRLLSSTYSLSTFRTWRGFPPFRNLSTHLAVTNKWASDVKKENKGDKQTKVKNREKKYIDKILPSSETWSGSTWRVVPDVVKRGSNVQPRCFIGYSKLKMRPWRFLEFSDITSNVAASYPRRMETSNSQPQSLKNLQNLAILNKCFRL